MEVFEDALLLALEVLVVFNVVKEGLEFVDASEKRGEGTLGRSFIILGLLALSFMEVARLIFSVYEVDIVFTEDVVLLLLFL